MKKSFWICWIAIVLHLLGCAHSSPVTYFSRPEVRKVSNEAFDAQIEALKLGNPFFVAFQLTITNKSSQDLEIDWNKTRYLLGSNDYGLFVFKGIDPESIKTGIPKELIPAGETLSKQISPLKTLGFKSKHEIHKPGQSNFYPAILPNGVNTVLLVVSQNTRELKTPLTVQIGTRAVME